MPELVGIEVDPALGDAEPDEEIHDLARRERGPEPRAGLPARGAGVQPGRGDGARRDRPATSRPTSSGSTRSSRTPTGPRSNPNLLVWHGRPWLIDHGAALYIHHTWRDPDEHARRPFERIGDHVLLPFAGSIAAADARHAATDRRADCSTDLVAALPDAWLPDDPVAGDAAAQRAAYVRYLPARLEAPRPFVEEAERARPAA